MLKKKAKQTIIHVLNKRNDDFGALLVLRYNGFSCSDITKSPGRIIESEARHGYAYEVGFARVTLTLTLRPGTWLCI